MLKIETLPLTAMRGINFKGQRPDEIAVVFNKERIRSIFRNKESQEKFMRWILVVGNALQERNLNAK